MYQKNFKVNQQLFWWLPDWLVSCVELQELKFGGFSHLKFQNFSGGEPPAPDPLSFCRTNAKYLPAPLGAKLTRNRNESCISAKEAPHTSPPWDWIWRLSPQSDCGGLFPAAVFWSTWHGHKQHRASLGATRLRYVPGQSLPPSSRARGILEGYWPLRWGLRATVSVCPAGKLWCRLRLEVCLYGRLFVLPAGQIILVRASVHSPPWLELFAFSIEWRLFWERRR